MHLMNILLAPISRPLVYLDPSSGSMIIQMALAAALGLGAAVTIFWKNIKSWFTKKKTGEDAGYDPTALPEDMQKHI